MTDREKLIALLDDTVGYTLDETADHLLANGVVVREKGEWKYYRKQGIACRTCLPSPRELLR